MIVCSQKTAGGNTDINRNTSGETTPDEQRPQILSAVTGNNSKSTQPADLVNKSDEERDTFSDVVTSDEVWGSSLNKCVTDGCIEQKKIRKPHQSKSLLDKLGNKLFQNSQKFPSAGKVCITLTLLCAGIYLESCTLNFEGSWTTNCV